MTPQVMAEIHARAFDGQGRAWGAEEIAQLLNTPDVFVVTQANGFALARVVLDEAEVLTIATDPNMQRSGTGRAVLNRLLQVAETRGAGRVFLEVAEDNARAIALYVSSGFRELGRRKGYARKPGGTFVDALVFERILISGPA